MEGIICLPPPTIEAELSSYLVDTLASLHLALARASHGWSSFLLSLSFTLLAFPAQLWVHKASAGIVA